MILPVLFLYILFQLVQSYDQKQEVLDYLDVQSKLDLYEELLSNPALYTTGDQAEYNRLEDYTQNKVFFTLYNEDGLIVFSTGSNSKMGFKENEESIYQDLYELRSTYETFEYKHPVFQNEELIGFYEISFLRLDWLSGVEDRKTWAMVLYIVTFIMIYAVVLYLLQRKLFRPLKQLIWEMNQFAKGEKVHPLPKKKDEMGELITHFEQMQKEINQKEQDLIHAHEQKQYMIASISHDLKTPLTAIRVNAEGLLEENELKETFENRLNTIVGKADYIHQLIDDLTMYNILQSSQYEIDTVEVEGQEFFEMVLSDYDQLADSYGIHFVQDVNVLGNYSVNTKQMLRLFDNLMMNALHHTDRDKMIWSTVFSTNTTLPEFLFNEAKEQILNFNRKLEGAWIVVQNEGEAIPTHEQEKLFEPLYQRDPSRSKVTNQGNRGSGLGLSIAKMIIEKLDGNIVATSTVGMGTTFICFLPSANSKKEVNSHE